MLINPYTPGAVLENFPNLMSDIEAYYDCVFDTVPDQYITPRYFFDSGLKVGFRDIFYYINRLYDNNPESVIDVGCGECTWKKWFPNVIGFDQLTNRYSAQDFIGTFNKDFSEKRAKRYDCGMAHTSLHYVDWDKIPAQIDMAMNIVKDRFLFTFNFNQIKNQPAAQNLIPEFVALLQGTNYNIEILDFPELRKGLKTSIHAYSHMNGHVRFILSHKDYTK